MDIIRIIKVKGLLGELDSLTEKEKYLLSFFNNLTKLKIEDIEERVGFSYEKDRRGLFEYYPNNKRFVISHHFVLFKIQDKFKLSNDEVREFILKFLIDRLGLMIKTTPVSWYGDFELY